MDKLDTEHNKLLLSNKRNEVLMYTTQINLKIMIGKRGQTRGAAKLFHLPKNIRKCKLIYSDRRQTDRFGERWGKMDRRVASGQKETLVVKNILSFVYISRCIKLYSLNTSSILYVNFILNTRKIKSLFKKFYGQ